MRRSALRAFLSAVEHRGQDFLKPRGLQKAALDVVGDEHVKLLHRHRAAHTAGLALAGLGGACVIPVASSLTSSERHRLAARGAKADAGKEGGTAHDARRRQGRAGDLRRDCTASNSAASMISTAISTTSASGLRSRVFQNLVLNRWRPT